MIVKFSQLSRLCGLLHNKTVVFAGGTFDLFHQGHIESFKKLRELGDVVVIAISSDKRVRQRKGPSRPILSQKERLILVDSIRYVDYSLVAPEPSKDKPVPTMQILARLRPDIFVTIDKRWLPFRKDIERLGTRLKIVPRGHLNSTTRIISRILSRYS